MYLVNFAVRADVLRNRVPPVFALETKDGYGFVSAVIARVVAMRPRGVPRLLGRDFDAVVYRVPVCYRSVGRTVRGVYFLRSDVSDWLLGLGGFWRRLFRAHVSRVSLSRHGIVARFSVVGRDASGGEAFAQFEPPRASQRLPDSSRFATLAEAQESLVELFVAFDYDATSREVTMVRIRRAHWDVRVADAVQVEFDYLHKVAGQDADAFLLDSVLYVPRVPYVWYSPVVEKRSIPRDSIPANDFTHR